MLKETKISSERILISLALMLFSLILIYSDFYENTTIKILKPLESFKIVSKENNLDTTSKINLNEASSENLESLKGVGKVIAQRIIDYRETHGGFSNIEEILNVKGIGNKFFEKIKDNIYV